MFIPIGALRSGYSGFPIPVLSEIRKELVDRTATKSLLILKF